MVFNVLPRKTKSASAGDHDVVGLLLHVVIYIASIKNRPGENRPNLAKTIFATLL